MRKIGYRILWYIKMSFMGGLINGGRIVPESMEQMVLGIMDFVFSNADIVSTIVAIDIPVALDIVMRIFEEELQDYVQILFKRDQFKFCKRQINIADKADMANQIY